MKQVTGGREEIEEKGIGEGLREEGKERGDRGREGAVVGIVPMMATIVPEILSGDRQEALPCLGDKSSSRHLCLCTSWAINQAVAIFVLFIYVSSAHL